MSLREARAPDDEVVLAHEVVDARLVLDVEADGAQVGSPTHELEGIAFGQARCGRAKIPRYGKTA